MPAPIRAMILLANVLDVRGLGPMVRVLTREPLTETTEIDGVSVELVRPGGTGPWPAWIFVNGAHPLRRREPVVERLAHGLARAGYLVVNPDLPGLGAGEITRRTLEATISVTEATVALPDVRGGRVALCGASAGASLALLVAEHPSLADRVSVVAAVTPWADLKKIIQLATTGQYEEDGRLVAYPAQPLLRRVIARSILAGLSAGDDRELLLEKLRRIDSDDVDPCEVLRDLGDIELRPGTAAAVDLLVNEDPTLFDDLYDALPAEVVSLVGMLSPLGEAPSLRAPVELVRPPVDQYFPLGEAHDLERSLPRARLTVTSTLDHTRPSMTLDHAADFVHFNGFVVRGLAAAVSSTP